MEPWCDPKKLEKVLTDGGFGKRRVQRREGGHVGEGQSRLRGGVVGKFWGYGCEELDG